MRHIHLTRRNLRFSTTQIHYHNITSWDFQPINKMSIFFQLQLQLQVFINDYIVAKDNVMPRGIMVL
jgi:hypothetical protein